MECEHVLSHGTEPQVDITNGRVGGGGGRDPNVEHVTDLCSDSSRGKQT